MDKFLLRCDSELLARLAKHALHSGQTQSAIIRKAISCYLRDNVNEEGIELTIMKRQREIEKGRPFDLHDGVMFAATVRDIVAKQKETIKKWRPLEPRDFDHFLSQVESERKVAETYEHKEWILEELRRLGEELRKEKGESKDA